MKRIVSLAFALVALFAVVGCAPRTAGPAALVTELTGDPELKIDYQLNTAAEDAANYFSFSGPIRYMAADKDKVDAASGASKANSTELFQPYLLDVKGKTTLSSGLRGLFLFAVNPFAQVATDNLTVSKAADGVITIQFVHRGTAYKLATDAAGVLAFPLANVQRRAIGYIKGAGPQVISADFSADGTAATVDWAKVWDKAIAGGKEIAAGVPNKTGDIVSDGPAAAAMYYWVCKLQVTLDGSILKIAGGLGSVKR